jgi:hypothetical protein
MSAADAAGLQSAIWELVDLSIASASFSLNSAPDYGAGAMITWVNSNSGAPAASLVALTGRGQDYVISVPDGGLTMVLLGIGMLGLSLVRRRARMI